MRAGVIAVIGLAVSLSAGAQTTPDAAVYIVAYVEVMPPSAADALTRLREYRDAGRQERGNVQLEVLQQIGRPDHVAVLEVWRDEEAIDAHRQSDHRARFRDAIERLRVSPYDERPHTGMAVGPAGDAPAAAVWVVTHADAVPTSKDVAVDLLTELADAGRQAAGNARFDVLQQTSRQNHFSVVETWNDDQAREAHAMSSRRRQFRDGFQALSGALWDERLYRIVE